MARFCTHACVPRCASAPRVLVGIRKFASLSLKDRNILVSLLNRYQKPLPNELIRSLPFPPETLIN